MMTSIRMKVSFEEVAAAVRDGGLMLRVSSPASSAPPGFRAWKARDVAGLRRNACHQVAAGPRGPWSTRVSTENSGINPTIERAFRGMLCPSAALSLSS